MFALFTQCVRGMSVRSNRLPQIAQKLAEDSAAVVADEDEDWFERPTFLDDSKAEELSVNFNKSRLLSQHRNVLHRNLPYNEPQSWIHLTEKYQRKMYGRYGAKSGVTRCILFPTQVDLKHDAVKEHMAQPLTLQQLVQNVRSQNEMKMEQTLKREDDITLKMGKLEKWKEELRAKTAKKEADAQAAKARKERLVEEVRRHFGFKVDPRDERFKDLLEKKEKEEKRKEKEARRRIKEEKMVVKLMQKNTTSAEKKSEN